MEKVPYLGRTLMRWQVGNSTFLAMPELGARLMNWHLTLGDGSVRDIVYWPEIKTLDDFHKVRGGNPVLFPFSARTFDQGQIGFWRDPAGVRRPMPMHGFARNGEFKVTRMDARGFTAMLVPNEEAKAAYPFNYEFSVAYRFSELGLSCEFTLRNFDTQPIPWSAGHHFYFTMPWIEGLARSDYAIRIPATKTLRQDAVGHLVAGPTLKPEEPLSNDALIDTFHLGLKTNTVIFGQPGKPGQVAVRNGTAAVPPPEATFVTWIPQDAAVPYYCVEPWMGPPNASETKVGLHWVEPGKSQSFVVEIAVK